MFSKPPPYCVLCKGYSPLKNCNLGQTLTLSKIFENCFENYITVVLGKKCLQKTPNIRNMTSFRNGRHVGRYAKDSPLKNRQFG